MTTIIGTKGDDLINEASIPAATITADSINGLGGNDIIFSLAGIDKIMGGDGNDRLIGGADADVINGGAGDDTASYETALSSVNIKLPDGAGTQTQIGFVIVGPTNYQITVALGGGDATGDKLSGIEHLTGSDYNDTLLGNSGANWLVGGLGKDLLQGGAGNDEIEGGADADILNGGFGDGYFDLKAGFDWVSYEHSLSAVTIDLTKVIQKGGDAEGDQIYNFAAVRGSAFDDILTGDALDNWFEGGAGKDQIDGGGKGAKGNTVSYEYALKGVTLDLTLGTQVGKGDENGDQLTNIQNIAGSLHRDVLKGDDGTQNYLWGDEGDDYLTATLGVDFLDGGDGCDWADFSPLLKFGIQGVSIKMAAPHVYYSIFQEDNVGKTMIAGGIDYENIRGTKGNDRITGNNIDNIIDPYGGFAFLDGGGNSSSGVNGKPPIGDTLMLSAYTDGVKVNMNLLSKFEAGYYQVDNFKTAFTYDVYYKNFENIYGTAAKDDITGNAGNNILEGGEENDTLNGGGGNDKLFGSNWRMPSILDIADTLNGGDGNDEVNGGAGGDKMDGGKGFDWLSYGGSSLQVTVTLNFGAEATTAGGDADDDKAINFENLLGSKYADILHGDIKANIIWGGRGNDALFGGEGNDAINGDSGDDEIYGGIGADKMDGGKGIDTLEFDVFDPNITVDLNKNKISATNDTNNEIKGDTIANFENVEGGNGNDVFTGNADVNVLEGMEGDDVIQGLDGADTLDGGDGNDTVSYALSPAGVVVDLTQQGGYIAGERDAPGAAQKGGDAEGDLLWGFENIVGSAKNDSLFGDEGVNKIDGGAGDDVIEGRGAGDELIGGLGIDTLSYDGETDALKVTLKFGLAADVSGNVGTDAENDKATGFENLLGGSANDVLTGDTKDNVIEGGEGADKMTGGGGKDTLSYAHATAGVSVLLDKGGILDAQFDAAEDDTGSGFTNMLGGKGDDALRFQGDAVAHAADGGAGDDFLEGAQGKDTLTGGAGNDDLVGHAGADVLNGGDGNDTFQGDADADTINGGAGDDTVTGGAGADIMDGGTGDDPKGDTLDYSLISGVNLTITLGATDKQTTVTSSKASDATGDKIKNFENIIGGDGNDVLTGNAGVNEILAGDGDDTVAGGGGADKLNGGNSLLTGDTVSYKASATGVSANLGSGEDSFGASLDELENIIGSAKNDELTGGDDANKIDGGMGDDLIEGGLSGDFLIGGVGSDTLSYEHSGGGVTITLIAGKDAQTGAAGDKATGFENLRGSANADTLTGDTKNNVIEGGDGGDTLTGGGGTDTLSYEHSGDGVIVDLTGSTPSGGDADGDTISGFTNLIGSSEGDGLIGDSKVNAISGGDGDDEIQGRGGADLLDGGDGTDEISYINSTAGVTVTLGKDGAPTIGAGAGSEAAGDKLSNFEDITGSSKADSLTGNNLANTLIGREGNDTLQGGIDVDTLSGGDGNDFFRYTSPTEGGDGIIDFNNTGGANGADKIQIVKAGFGIPAGVTIGGAGDKNFTTEYFVSAADHLTAANKSHGQFIFDTNDFDLYWDPDGNNPGLPVLIASFANNAVLTAADFDLK